MEEVLSGEGHENAEMSAVFIGEEEMAEINQKYRNKKGATDILSFPQDGFGLEGTDINFIGEIIICPLKIKNQAKLAGVSYDEEMARVLIHGTLHLLGYDHEESEKEEEIMAKKENFYLSSALKKTDLYF